MPVGQVYGLFPQVGALSHLILALLFLLGVVGLHLGHVERDPEPVLDRRDDSGQHL
jgi:hypothetical protein